MDRENRNIEVAVLLSLLLHAFAFGSWQFRTSLLKLPGLNFLSKLVQVMHPPQKPAAQQVQTLTFVELTEPRATSQPLPKERVAKQFMETDPSQVTGEKPRDAKYYSDKSTVAANPNNPTGKTGDTPYLNGSETRLPNTLDVPSPSGVSAPAIMQPGSPGSAGATKATPRIVEEPPQPKPPVQPQPKAQEQPKEVAPVGLKMVEEQKVAMAPKPTPQPQVVTGETVPEVPAADAARPGAPAMVSDPGVAGREIVARKAHLTVAGVSRDGVAAFGVEESPFGAYDKKLIKAVQSHWYALIDRFGMYESAATVTVHFQLLDDGQVQDVKTIDSTGREILSLFCEKAIIQSGPFDPLPENLRALVGKEPREISFTFYY